VFSLYAGGNIRGERTSNYSNLWGGFSVEKVTKEWKFELETDFGNTVEKFDLDEGKITSRNNVKIGDALLVKSLSEHWSVGGQFFLGSISFSNFKLKSSVFPGIEYNIFPYSESARKQIRFMYSAGMCGHIQVGCGCRNDSKMGFFVSLPGLEEQSARLVKKQPVVHWIHEIKDCKRITDTIYHWCFDDP
jgi:hypothetical protein